MCPHSQEEQCGDKCDAFVWGIKRKIPSLFSALWWIYLSSHTRVHTQTNLLTQLDKLACLRLFWWLGGSNASDKVLSLRRGSGDCACSAWASQLLTAAIFGAVLQLRCQPTSRPPSTLLSPLRLFHNFRGEEAEGVATYYGHGSRGQLASTRPGKLKRNRNIGLWNEG